MGETVSAYGVWEGGGGGVGRYPWDREKRSRRKEKNGVNPSIKMVAKKPSSTIVASTHFPPKAFMEKGGLE